MNVDLWNPTCDHNPKHMAHEACERLKCAGDAVEREDCPVCGETPSTAQRSGDVATLR
jgi:hypothetical protein